MDQPAGADVRCSVVVFRGPEVLLVRRLRNGASDWVLPGGTPRPGESMAACVRRETLEETGLAVEPGRIAFVLETQGPQSGLHTLDLVFLASPSELALEPQSPEPDLSAQFVPLGQLHRLDLRPPIAGHLRGLRNRGALRTAAYLGNLWRPRRHDDGQPTLVELPERRRRVAKVSEDEVLLLWRALMAYRSGPRPACQATGRPPRSPCPLHDQCPRWAGPDDYLAIMEETPEQTERRRAAWPCTRLADLLSPELRRIGPG